MKTAYITKCGVKHEINQDSFFLNAEKDNFCILCVADGMGGYRQGEESSALLVENLKKSVPENFDDEILRTHRNIIRTNHINNIKSGTTVAVAIIDNDVLTVKNVGDSRVLIVNETEEKVVSFADTLLNHMIRSGQLTRPQRQNHPKKNVITQCVGLGETPDIHTSQFTLFADDCVVVTCDGGFNFVQPGEFSNLCNSLKNGDENVLNDMVATLRRRGEKDDITILVAY